MADSEQTTDAENRPRRCAICGTGRRWRDFKSVERDGQEPVVVCPACAARFAAAAQMPTSRQDAAAVVPAAAEPAKGAATATAPAAAGAETGNAGGASKRNGRNRGNGAKADEGGGNGKPNGAPRKPKQAPREDRLRRALRELPHGEYSVARVAKAAGLNHAKALTRLRALQEAGEVQQVGNRWSNEPPSTDVDAAFDRLKARTSNLRIITDRKSDR